MRKRCNDGNRSHSDEITMSKNAGSLQTLEKARSKFSSRG